ncbi:hypothetical protein ACFFRR_005065 [Megaselia abdita]
MRRRSERKKTPEVSSSPAPATRRTSRRSRKTASPSPEKHDNESAEQDETQTPKSRRRTSSTPSKDHSPAKKGRMELNKIVEENGEDANVKEADMEKSIEETEEVVKSRKLSSDDKNIVDEKESDIKEKKVRQTDKNLDDKERTTEIQTPELIEPEKPLEKDEKSPSKRKRSKEREKSSSSSERTHRKDKEHKSRQKSIDKENEEDNSIVLEINTTVLETNGDKDVEPSEQIETKETVCVKTVEDDKQKTVKKRKWVSRKSSENKIMAISTDSLKCLIADPVHPVPLSDVHLDSSPEIEVVQSESEAHIEEADQAQFTKKDRESHRKSPEKRRPSKEELEEGEEDSEEEEGQIEREREKPSVKTNSSPILYITNLVRPFTIMQLKGLLARTGKIVENGFWIDRIKSKCYVKFDNEDEAIETRHALHGVRWPTSNPKCLNVEFGTEEAMNVVLSSMEETPKFGSENTKENRMVGIGWDGNGFEEERKVVRQVREWDMGKREEFQKERTRERTQEERKEQKEVDKRNPFREAEKEEERRGRERRHRSPSYDKHRRSRSISPVRRIKKDNEPPLRLLDDLFRKTKTAPCVYWLPLTPEQIVEKEQRRLKRVQEVEEHRREREKREKERERQRETEREQRRNRNRSGERDRIRERSRDDRRRSRSRDRRRY